MSRGSTPTLPVYLLLVGLLVGLLLGPLSLVLARPAPARAAGASPALLLTRVLPAALAPGDRLTISGQVLDAAGSAAGSATARVRLRLARSRNVTLSALDEWQARPPGAAAGSVVAGSATALTGSGPDRSFTISLPAAALGLTGRPDGSYDAAVELLSGSGQRLALARTFLLWWPQPDAAMPTRLSVLLPLVQGTPVAGLPALAAQLATGTAPGSRLSRLSRAAGAPGLTLAVDPALVAVAQAYGSGGIDLPASSDAPSGSAGTGTAGASAGSPGTGPGSASPSTTGETSRAGVQDWLSGLRSSVTGHEVVALPYGDVDLESLAHADSAGLLRRAAGAAPATVQRVLGSGVLGGSVRSALGWPHDGLLDQAGLDASARSGLTRVVVADTQVPLTSPPGYPVTGRTDLDADGPVVPAVVADSTLTQLLSSTATSGAAQPAQRLLAELATITLGRPNDQRALLAVLPRDLDPAPGALTSVMTALSQAPWVQLQPLSALVATPAPAASTSAARTLLPYPAPAAAQDLPAGPLQAFAAADTTVAAYTGVVQGSGPATLTDARSATLLLASNAWRAASPALAEAGTPLLRLAAQLRSAIGLGAGGPYNILAKTAALPLRVRNDLPWGIQVWVQLRPRSGRLAADGRQPVTVPPHSNALVQAAVRGVASGDVVVRAYVESVGGRVLQGPVDIQVRVRPTWESRGLGAVAVVLALLVLFGLARTVRSGRRSEPQGPEPVGSETIDG